MVIEINPEVITINFVRGYLKLTLMVPGCVSEGIVFPSEVATAQLNKEKTLDLVNCLVNLQKEFK